MASTPSRPTPSPLGRANRRTALLLCAVAALVAAGCGRSEEITAYDEDKPGTALASAKNRILAAIFFRDEGLWAFKLVGPEAKVRDIEQPLREFLLSVRFKDGEPEWKIPAAGPKWVPLEKVEGRYAGYQVGPKDDNTELTVNKVGRGKDRQEDLLANVNRWRVQLNLMKLPKDSDDLANFVKLFDEKGAEKFYLVDLTGTGSGRTAMAGVGPGIGPKRAPGDIMRDREPVTYDKPKEWHEVKQEGPRKQFDDSRATLEVGEGEARAVVTITPFDRSKFSVLRNVNRWRTQQLDLPAITEDELPHVLTKVNVNGTDSDYFDQTGKPGPDCKRMLVILIPDKQKFWIIKMLGPAETVGKNKGLFELFAKSVKFPGGR
jgi:hypothetical protein